MLSESNNSYQRFMKEGPWTNVLTGLLMAMLIAVASMTGVAQTFPVQASIQLTPPYSPYLADYIAPGSQKLFVQLLTNDVSIIDHPIKLRVTIEGVGITIRTKQTFNPTQQLILYGGGAPTVFYGEDIAEYFSPDNLDFAGISRKDFDKTGKLPEGIYRISVEVYSFNRNVIISNKAQTMAWIILNDPPLLNLPRKDMKVRIIDPANIAFTWTPRHTGSPNSAFTTEYIFRLVEIWPANRNPYDAFLSQVPLYEVTTDQTQIVYGPAEPAMIPGRNYAWQVQAKDTESRDVFKNDGRSEVYVFQFGDALSAPENITQDGGNSATVNLSWDSPSQGEMPQAYRVRYRQKGAGNDATWYESVTTQRWITLSDLQANANYDVQIRSEARPQLSDYSQLLSAKTTEETASPYTCGLQVVIPPPTSISPLLILKKGDVITSRNFKVYVTESQGLAGVFTGKGTMPVPFLNMATVNVVFSGIKVNSNYELVAGEIITAFNPGSNMAKVIDAANKIGEKPEPKQNKTDSVEVDAPLEYKIDGTIDSVFVDSNGDIVVLDEKGNKTSYKQPVDSTTQAKKPIVISDSSGNNYLVQQDPVTKQTTVTKMGDPSSASKTTPASNATPKEKKLIAEILKRFENQIASILAPTREPVFPRGAGPIADDAYIPFPPSCMPEDQDLLKIIKEYLAKISNDQKLMDAFIDIVYQNPNDKQAIVAIAGSVDPKDDQKFEDVLNSDDLSKAELTLCSYSVEGAKDYVTKLWWSAPYWERAAKILKEHFEDLSLYQDVTVECSGTSCKTVGIIKITDDATASIEVNFNDQITPSDTWDILTAHGVDFWEGRSVTLENFKERFWNYMAMKDDHLYQGKGWESETLKIFADVLMAAPGTVEGWVTGKHWRTGEELAMWEHVLGILDVVPTEAFAKAGVTAFVIKIGGKLIDVTKFTQPVKNFILSAYGSGLKLLIKSKDEIAVFASDGVQQIGRLLNGVFQDLYWVYGGERILAKLAGVKYMVDPSTKKIVDGTLEIVEDGEKIGIRAATIVVKLSDEIDKVLASLKTNARYLLDGTGEWNEVGGHHPLAKRAFEGDLNYNWKKAFCVSPSQLDEISGVAKVHGSITGQQIILYGKWRKANPTAKLTIDVMADIEINAMKNVGIPDDVATGWVIKALEDLKAQGATVIVNIPWNGVN